MASKTAIYVGIISAVVIGGGLIWWMKIRKDNNTGEKVHDKEKETSGDVTPTAVETGASTSSTSSFPKTPFKDTTEGNAFRVWMSKAHPDFRYLNDVLDPAGAYDNDFIRKAYQMYGAEYVKTGGAVKGSSSSSAPSGYYNVLYAKRDGDNIYTVTVSGGGLHLGSIVGKTTAGGYLGEKKGATVVDGISMTGFNNTSGKSFAIATSAVNVKQVPKK